ncbi:MAG: DUF1475 family protein [Acidimicrobiia bacterium]|jgi:hypothetical protein
MRAWDIDEEATLTGIRVLAALVAAAMAGAIAYGFAAGDFVEEGRAILDLAWGKVTLIDLYAGLTLIGAWIVARERSLVRALPWLAGLFVLGSLAVAVYVLVSSIRANNLRSLLLGTVD